MRPGIITLSPLLLAACLASHEPSGGAAGDLVYGTDDRIEAFEATTANELRLFDSEVALFGAGLLTPVGDGYDIDVSETLADYRAPLCADEPFGDQPVPAFCSGFVVGPDLIATAGHCVRRARDCSQTSFVFGFHMRPDGTPVSHVTLDQVYRCASIVGSVQSGTVDYAVLRTDRTIEGDRALPLRRSGAVMLGTPLAVIGHPVGLPTKYADNATVRANAAVSYFESNLDVYGGNSGSAVVSEDSAGNLLVEGILVRGNPDWAFDGTCWRSNQCPDTGCGGTWEEVTRATVWSALVPVPTVCGDGTCGGSETCSSCSADCGTCPVCAPKNASCSSDAACCSGDCNERRGSCR